MFVACVSEGAETRTSTSSSDPGFHRILLESCARCREGVLLTQSSWDSLKGSIAARQIHVLERAPINYPGAS
jgi:hypothetical protein